MSQTMNRPSWQIPAKEYPDLVKNIHFDKKTDLEIKKILGNSSSAMGYADPYPLYQSICEYYNQPIAQTFISNGATDVIDRMFRFLDFDNVYIVEPTFEMVRVYAEIYGKNILTSMVDPPENSLLYYASPNGQSGKLENGVRHDGFKYIIIDEVYADFCPEHSLVGSRFENEIVVKSVSKSLGAAGLRVGMCFADEIIIQQLQHTRSNVVVNSMAVEVVSSLIHTIPDVVERMNETRELWKQRYKCIDTKANFVIFPEPNELTEIFPCREVEEGLRLSLMDKDTWYEFLHQDR